MTDDIRIYNYLEDGSLISQGQQAKKYFDEKFANITLMLMLIFRK